MNINILTTWLTRDGSIVRLDKPGPYDFLLIHSDTNDTPSAEIFEEETGALGNAAHDGIIIVYSPLQQGFYTTIFSTAIHELIPTLPKGSSLVEILIHLPIVTNVNPSEISEEIRLCLETLRNELHSISDKGDLELTIAIESKHTLLHTLLEKISN